MDNGGTQKEQDASDLTEMMREIGRDVNVKMVYGEPQMLQGRSLIPVAQIHYAGGAGFGSGAQAQAQGRTEEGAQPQGEGRGGGAGLRVTAKPLGMMEVTGDGERWVPALDYNRLITIWSLVGGFLLVTIVRGLMKVMAGRVRSA